jgi:hypothetical protein
MRMMRLARSNISLSGFGAENALERLPCVADLVIIFERARYEGIRDGADHHAPRTRRDRAPHGHDLALREPIPKHRKGGFGASGR